MRPRLYAELADWWELVSPVADYAGAATTREPGGERTAFVARRPLR